MSYQPPISPAVIRWDEACARADAACDQFGGDDAEAPSGPSPMPAAVLEVGGRRFPLRRTELDFLISTLFMVADAPAASQSTSRTPLAGSTVRVIAKRLAAFLMRRRVFDEAPIIPWRVAHGADPNSLEARRGSDIDRQSDEPRPARAAVR